MARWRRTALLLAVLTCTAPAAAHAQGQLTIGADLNRPANAAYGCERLPITDFAGGRTFLPSGQATCTYLATGVLGGTAETTTPVVAGLVTAIRVKAGPVTGPMQVTVLRSTRTLATPECCFYAGATPAFTPAPNAVTTIPARIFLANYIDVNGRETVDRLGITVLAPGVPIPAHETGSPGTVTNPAAMAWFPAVGPGDVATGRVDGAGIGGVQPLIQADLVPFCPSSGARTAQSAACLAVLALRQQRVRVRNGRAPLSLVCNATTPCTGPARVQARATGGTTFAAGSLTVQPGASATARLALTRTGRARLRARGRISGFLNAAIQADGRTVRISRRVTLRR